MNTVPQLPVNEALLLYALSIWTLIWKGISMWRAAKYSQRNWFIVLLILNTLGILDIVYLFFFSKKKMTFEEIKSWFRNIFTQKKKAH